MSVLSYLHENHMLTRLKDASAEQVKNAFFANYLASLVMLKLQDIDGLHLINDPHSADLTRFKDRMSDLNFWAKALFQSDDADVKNRLMYGHAEALSKASGRVVKTQINSILKVPNQSPDQINWNEVVGRVILLKHRFGVQSSYLGNLTRYIYTWEKLSSTGRRKAVNDAFMYLMQADPKSALLPRLRALSNSVMINAVDGVIRKLIGFKKLNEDDGGGGDAGTGVGNVATGDSCNNLIITPPSYSTPGYKLEKQSPHQVTKKSKLVFKDGKIIRKKRKGFKPRKYKLPDYLKAEKMSESQSHRRKVEIMPHTFINLLVRSRLQHREIDAVKKALGNVVDPIGRADLERVAERANVSLNDLLNISGIK